MDSFIDIIGVSWGTDVSLAQAVVRVVGEKAADK